MRFQRRVWGSAISITMLVLLAATITVRAQGSESKESSKKTGKSAMKVTVEGELRVETKGSETKNIRADQYALKVTRVVASDGEELTDLRGRTLRFARNSKREELVRKHNEGARLAIKGQLQVENGLLEVESFRPVPGSVPAGSETKNEG